MSSTPVHEVLESWTPPRRVILLCNPASGRMRRRPSQLGRLRRLVPASDFYEATDLGNLLSLLHAMAPGPDDLLCIVGGDGTAHMTLTALHRRLDRDAWPALMLIPAGSTNMIALDFGARGSLRRSLRRFERWIQTGAGAARVVSRPLLRITWAGGPDLCGTFFGTGVVTDAVRYFRTSVRDRGPAGEWSSFSSIRFVLTDLFRHGPDSGGVQQLGARIDSGAPHLHEAVLCLITSLERLVLGSRPYWNASAGPLRWTIVEVEARRFWLRMWRVIMGRPGAVLREDEGYFSGGVERAELKFDGPFVVDGELYESSADHPITVTTDRTLRWIVPA